MKRSLQMVSWLALVGTLLPSILFFAGRMELAAVKSWMLVATLVWFAVTPFWMERKID